MWVGFVCWLPGCTAKGRWGGQARVWLKLGGAGVLLWEQHSQWKESGARGRPESSPLVPALLLTVM